MLLALALPALAGPPCGTPARLAAHGGRPAPAPPVAHAAGGACIDPNVLAANQDVDGDYSETLATDHFLLAWDPSNPAVDEASVALYADAYDLAWGTQVDQLGWKAPDGDGCLLTVLLADFPDAWGDTGGWTDVAGSSAAPFMILNTDWQTNDAEVETLVYHEFNHASQFAYDVFWEEDDWWYWEATAEWIPEIVDPTADTWTWSLWTYLDAPHLALESTVSTAAYGHFVFNGHLAENWDVDAPRAIWAAVQGEDHVEDGVEAALGEGAFREVVVGMAAHAAAFDVADADVWEAALDEFQVDPYEAHVTAVPAEGNIASGRGAPQEGGQGFLHLDGDAGPVRLALALTQELDGTPVDWAVTLATSSGGVVTYEELDVASDGAAAVSIAELGGAVEDAWIAVTPMGAIGDSGAGWSWSATRTAGDDGIALGDDEGEDPKGGCGCGTGAAPSGLGALLALAALRRRRRIGS